MVAKKTAVSRTASARSTVAAAAETTEQTPETGPEPGGQAPAAKTTKKAAKKTAKKAAKKAVKKTAAKKAAAGKPPAKKAAAMEAAEAAEQTGAHRVVAKKSASRATATAGKGAAGVPQARVATAPGELAVRPGEDPWTSEEVDEARAGLSSEVMRLRSELEASGAALAGLMRDSGDGAGDDDADTGTKNITREHELSLAANAQEMLEQSERALARLDAGTYGLCEVCGKPIGKARMQAFPRATLCVEDKQKQERRG
ncbi:TraR/DksA family transcriptional regulator [Streptomyces sp. NPDC055749]